MKLHTIILLIHLTCCSSESTKTHKTNPEYENFAKWFDKSLVDFSIIDTQNRPFHLGDNPTNSLDHSEDACSIILSMYLNGMDTRIISWYWASSPNRYYRTLLISIIACGLHGDNKTDFGYAHPWNNLSFYSENERKNREDEIRFVFQNRHLIASLILNKVDHLLSKTDSRYLNLIRYSDIRENWNPLPAK